MVSSNLGLNLGCPLILKATDSVLLAPLQPVIKTEIRLSVSYFIINSTRFPHTTYSLVSFTSSFRIFFRHRPGLLLETAGPSWFHPCLNWPAGWTYFCMPAVRRSLLLSLGRSGSCCFLSMTTPPPTLIRAGVGVCGPGVVVIYLAVYLLQDC